MRKRKIWFNLAVLVSILFITWIISLWVYPYNKEDIYGIWEGQHNNEEILFTFHRDGTCILRYTDIFSGAVETISGNFEMDFSKQPLPLTIRNIPQLDHPLYTIVKFTGQTVVSIASFAPRWRLRPVSFDPQTSINLKKKGDV